jgi:hypothetical protein
VAVPARFGFFKFGALRNEHARELLEAVIASPRFVRYVSDEHAPFECHGDDVIVRRRFTADEALRYAAGSHFSLFIREPVLNSGVINFYWGSRLAVFHTPEAVRHIDLPPGMERFAMTDTDLHPAHINDTLATTPLPGDEMNGWLAERTPARVSHRWWQAALAA